MARKPRRVFCLFQLEALEARALLSGDLMTGTGPWVPQTPLPAASTLLLRFKADTSQSRQNTDLGSIGAEVVQTFPDGPSVVALPPWVRSSAALALLKANPDLAYVDSDAPLHSLGAVIPNDPGFAQQYALTAIDAPDAWGITTGTSSTIIAVLDSGVDLNSPDLDPHLWTNPAHPSQHGWNFINNNSNIQDLNGHGTNVTGILAAIGNNGIGVAGVDWNAQIMPLKVLDSQGNGSTQAAVNAIYFAVQHGAKVINASWGGAEFSQAMIDAINYAGSQGAVFVTAAGNDSSNNDVTQTYPASYRLANELVVAATDQNGALASFSNYGASTVDLAAPGVNILSTVPGGYAEDTGTSMSTPFVSGTLALVAGLHPDFSAAQLVNDIKTTVTPDAALKGLVATGGVVNAYFALLGHVVTPPNISASSTPSFQTVETAMLATSNFYSLQGGTPTGFVTGLYHALLGRAPDSAGLGLFVNQLNAGATRAQVISEFQVSPEAQLTRVARWFIDEVSPVQTLAQLKANPGLAGWGTRFSSGETVSQAQQDILSSNAYYTLKGSTPTGFITSLYNGLLGRAPDAQGLATYVAQLGSGYSRAQLVQEFLSSNEGHLTTSARFFQEEFGDTVDSIAKLKTEQGVAFWAAGLGQD
jgi:subtilisin family serine protease